VNRPTQSLCAEANAVAHALLLRPVLHLQPLRQLQLNQ
jgi:hypothetical protein